MGLVGELKVVGQQQDNRMAQEYTEEEVMQQLAQLANTTAVSEDKHNTHAFLHAVATAEDTTKVGYLKEEEVGIPRLSQRTIKELELYARDIAGDEGWADFFKKKSEILTSTSLSKDAKLLDLSVVNRVETSNVTKNPPRKVNRSWFGRKNSELQV